MFVDSRRGSFSGLRVFVAFVFTGAVMQFTFPDRIEDGKCYPMISCASHPFASP